MNCRKSQVLRGLHASLKCVHQRERTKKMWKKQKLWDMAHLVGYKFIYTPFYWNVNEIVHEITASDVCLTDFCNMYSLCVLACVLPKNAFVLPFFFSLFNIVWCFYTKTVLVLVSVCINLCISHLMLMKMRFLSCCCQCGKMDKSLVKSDLISFGLDSVTNSYRCEYNNKLMKYTILISLLCVFDALIT